MRSNLHDPDDHEPLTAEEFARNVELIRESIADMEAGDCGRPAREVIDELRVKLGLNRNSDTERE